MHAQTPQVLLAVAASVLLVTVAEPGQGPGPHSEPTQGLQETPEHTGPWFEVYHLDSRIGGIEFEEVFLVDRVSDDWSPAIANITVLLDEKPLPEAFNFTWQDANGILDRNDTFTFEMEAFDVQVVLSAQWEGQKVMECRMGGGAGNSNIHPDEMRAMGQQHLVRCLDEISDF